MFRVEGGGVGVGGQREQVSQGWLPIKHVGEHTGQAVSYFFILQTHAVCVDAPSTAPFCRQASNFRPELTAAAPASNPNVSLKSSLSHLTVP